jgi:hypothetical protein
MGVPIRIDEEIYEEAKRIAKAECRSIPQQIEYWARKSCLMQYMSYFWAGYSPNPSVSTCALQGAGYVKY